MRLLCIINRNSVSFVPFKAISAFVFVILCGFLPFISASATFVLHLSTIEWFYPCSKGLFRNFLYVRWFCAIWVGLDSPVASSAKASCGKRMCIICFVQCDCFACFRWVLLLSISFRRLLSVLGRFVLSYVILDGAHLYGIGVLNTPPGEQTNGSASKRAEHDAEMRGISLGNFNGRRPSHHRQQLQHFSGNFKQNFVFPSGPL